MIDELEISAGQLTAGAAAATSALASGAVTDGALRAFGQMDKLAAPSAPRTVGTSLYVVFCPKDSRVLVKVREDRLRGCTFLHCHIA